MESIERAREESQEDAIAGIQRTGRVAASAEELYGPGPAPDDPEDLESFLALLEAQRRPAEAPFEEED